MGPQVAYFSMEIGLRAEIPTYSGGLGVLAGDTLKAMADLGAPVVGVTLLHRAGYFFQRLDDRGRQSEAWMMWRPADHLVPLAERVAVEIEGRRVLLGAWRRDVVGEGGHVVPILFLDSDVDGNEPGDRRWTDALYGGDERYRLGQEVILGIGGLRMLRAVYGPAAGRAFGHTGPTRFHMNEGHAALLTAELLHETAAAHGWGFADDANVHEVRQACVFTTHTPVPAGHDRFSGDLARHILGNHEALGSALFMLEGTLDMTHAALNLSRFANGVSRKHGEVARSMHPGREIGHITNGVHGPTWAGPAMAALFDRVCPGWRGDGRLLAKAELRSQDVSAAHACAKAGLIARVNRSVNAGMEVGALTIGCARRATPYKRLDLVLSRPEELARIAREHGPLQFIFAGKAHPRDFGGKANIERIFELGQEAGRISDGLVRVAFMPQYDMDLCAAMVSGVDVWLNTPMRPLEASGTSGMKAAINGVPSLSILDGWWIEGCDEGVTGWSIGELAPPSGTDLWQADGEALYRRLGEQVAPLFARDRDGWSRIMVEAIRRNGSRFSTHRMAADYLGRAYGLETAGVG